MRFQPTRRPLMCKPVADAVLEARSRGKNLVEISLDLGRSFQKAEITGRGVRIGGIEIGWDLIELAAGRERDIYAIEEGGLSPLCIASEHFYKLVLVKWMSPPTLEIDGIHMHRILDVTPDVDSEMKVELLGSLRCRRVLDICTGLGYTAIAALRRGACSVTTIEKDVNVIELAKLNPWSWELASENVELIIGDAVELLEGYEGEFDAAIHDPPRFPLAGELYSLEFYKRLARALRPGGRVVHYVGQPGVHRGMRIWKGVLERMRMAGFEVDYDERSRCVYGYRKR